MKKIKLLLINLPIPDFIKDHQRGNSQIFSGYIESIIINNKLNNIELIKLSRKVIETFNNNALVDEIIKIKPDIVGFSSYLWNIDRNMDIAVKLKGSGIITITGGPEISRQNKYLFENSYFDYFIEYEGEYLLIDLINRLKSKNTNDNFLSDKTNINFNDFIFTYTKISDDYKVDGLFYLEMERGCPYKCNYCAYNKFRKEITSIDLEIFKNCIDEIYKKEIDEIYLLAPTLNRNKKRFREYLKYIINVKNKSGKKIKLFSELRAELLDDDDIGLMEDAGFTDLEFGVQTLNVESYNKLNRKKLSFNPIELSKKLLANNITPLIDFMIGLPHDDYSKIIKTIDLFDKNNLLEYSNFYHLHVLANTGLRNVFDREGYIYKKRSPYLAYQVNTLNFNDINNIYYYIENKKKYTFSTDFFNYEKSNFYILKNDNDLDLLEKTPFYNFAVFLMIDDFNESKLLNFLNDFVRNNKEVFIKLFIYSKKEISIEFLNKLNEIFISNKNYYDLYREGLNYSGERTFSKLFHILLKPDDKKSIFEKYNEKFLVDFILFPEEMNKLSEYSKLIEEYYRDYGTYTYIFKNSLKIEENEYIRVFPFEYEMIRK